MSNGVKEPKNRFQLWWSLLWAIELKVKEKQVSQDIKQKILTIHNAVEGYKKQCLFKDAMKNINQGKKKDRNRELKREEEKKILPNPIQASQDQGLKSAFF